MAAADMVTCRYTHADLREEGRERERERGGEGAYGANGFRPLRLAAFHGQVEAVKVLVQPGRSGREQE
jgi:hypothetical protein